MKTFRVRLIVVGFSLLVLTGVIVARLVTVQIVHRNEYSRRSRQQTLQRRVVQARRGRLLDRRGRELAASVGTGTGEHSSRLYANGELAAALLGFVGRDGYGLGGAELAFDRQLRGEDGWTIVQRDARIRNGRQRKYNVDLPSKPPRDGSDTYLTIDIDVQTILQSVLRQTIERCQAKAAMGIVMDPSTGKVLAMANEPTFDPNFVSRYSLRERTNPCISLNYEPGSTYKLVAAAAAVEEGTYDEDDTLSGNDGVYLIYDQAIRDHKPFGTLTFRQALAHSSNVCFAKIADRLGNDCFYGYTRDFGFGQRTGIALPGEEAGIVHPIRQWSGRTRVTMAIGHEISATLLQVVTLYGAVANDGVLLQPRICERVIDTYGNTTDESSAHPVRRVVSSSASRRLREMLCAVVDTGTGTRAAIEDIRVAGKTGTSSKLDSATNSYSDSCYYTSFVGFVPVEEPALLCGIVVDEPQIGKAGGLAAAPAFRKVIEQIIAHPDLEFAERILRSSPVPDKEFEQKNIPMVCGLPVEEATERLASAGIAWAVVGDADTVTHQSPRAGVLPTPNASVKLYANRAVADEADSVLHVAVPECRGRDLRDALSMLNIRGLKPCVRGAGRVVDQRPTVGSVVAEAVSCTLFCSFDG